MPEALEGSREAIDGKNITYLNIIAKPGITAPELLPGELIAWPPVPTKRQEAMWQR